MMIQLQETSRAGAIDYMWTGLRQGKTLAGFVLRAIDFQHGTVEALVPDSYARNEIQEFGRGHATGSGGGRSIRIGRVSGLAFPKVNVRDEIAELIYRLLDAGRLCLIENPLASVGDPWLDRAKSRLAVHDGEVYHFLTSAERDISKIAQALRESHHPPVSWGAIGRDPRDCPTKTGRTAITSDELARFAETVRCVFVSAYDDEGYIVWRD